MYRWADAHRSPEKSGSQSEPGIEHWLRLTDWTIVRTQSQSMSVTEAEIAEIGAIVRQIRRRIVGESHDSARSTLTSAVCILWT